MQKWSRKCVFLCKTCIFFSKNAFYICTTYDDFVKKSWCHGGEKLFNNCYNFDFRPKPPHASLTKAIFEARMRGFWLKVKTLGVIDCFYTAIVSWHQHFLQNHNRSCLYKMHFQKWKYKFYTCFQEPLMSSFWWCFWNFSKKVIFCSVFAYFSKFPIFP